MRSPLCRVVLIGIIAMATNSGAAQASPFTLGLDHAYRLAVHYWGGKPPLCTSLDAQIVPDATLHGPSGELAYAVATQPDSPQPCVLWIERWLAAPIWFNVACTVTVHEVGHLRGLGHSLDPANVMYPYDRGSENEPAICWRAYRRWGPRFGRGPRVV
jgi:Predicted Zn-dependent proteases